MIEARKWQAEKEANSAVQGEEGIAESALDVLVRTSRGSGIGNTPVRGHRLAGPYRADFVPGFVANRENKIHPRGAGFGELIPALAMQAGKRQPRSVQLP